MVHYYGKDYILEECKNNIYSLFKNNVYLNDKWFIFLDYYEFNINITKYKILLIVMLFIIILFIKFIIFYIIFYVIVMYIKYYNNKNNSLKKNKKRYHYIAKLFPSATKSPVSSFSNAKIFV